MKLNELLENIEVIYNNGNQLVEITSICSDSRKCKEGSLFIAIKGADNDGHKYIESAIKNGAAAIVCSTAPDFLNESAIPFAVVKDDRRAAALIAKNFYGNPSGCLKLVGVTGTNGKTSIATLLYRTFTKMGYCCGLLSTIADRKSVV